MTCVTNHVWASFSRRVAQSCPKFMFCDRDGIDKDNQCSTISSHLLVIDEARHFTTQIERSEIGN
jgi:hypothetical protein